MGQRLQPWRSPGGEKLWLSALVDAMEQASRTEVRAVPCDPLILIALEAQLAFPVSPYLYGTSTFSLRN
jgi:hypothetical protein